MSIGFQLLVYRRSGSWFRGHVPVSCSWLCGPSFLRRPLMSFLGVFSVVSVASAVSLVFPSSCPCSSWSARVSVPSVFRSLPRDAMPAGPVPAEDSVRGLWRPARSGQGADMRPSSARKHP